MLVQIAVPQSMELMEAKFRAHANGQQRLSPEALCQLGKDATDLYRTLDEAAKEHWQRTVGDAWRSIPIAVLRKTVTAETKLWEISAAEFHTHRPELALARPSTLPVEGDWDASLLRPLPLRTLKALLILDGLIQSGSKADMVARLLANKSFRLRFDGKTPEQITAELSAKEIDKALSFLGAGKYGNKRVKAITILNTIREQRGRGLGRLAEYNYHLGLLRAYRAGEPVPAEFIDRYHLAQAELAADPQLSFAW